MPAPGLPGYWLFAGTILLAASIGFHLFSIFSSHYDDGVPIQVEEPPEARNGWRGELMDDPAIKIAGSNLIQCYCPANGAFLGTVRPATTADIDNAIQKAREAQKSWAQSTFVQRRRVLRTLLKFLLENQESICTVACLDSGKTRVDAIFGEILVTAEKLRWTIKHGAAALKPSRRPTNILMMYKRNEVRYEPLGVVAACVSWNYPFHNIVSPIIAALFTGNAIVVKPSERTAWSSQYFVRIVQKCLEACGHSRELVQNCVCWPDVAPYLTSHPGLSHITFIGSREVGRLVAASASKALIPVCMELGGKDAAIVLNEVADSVSELNRVSNILIRGTFQSAGQNCIGIERVLATPRVYQKLVEKLPNIVKCLRVGSALDSDISLRTSFPVVDVGAVISSEQFDFLEQIIEEAIQSGAKLLAGTGRRVSHPEYPQGHYFSPTLLADVEPDMRIAQEELFAPVMVLMRVKDADDALAVANSTSKSYALGASVFGCASSPDVYRLIRGLRSGMVSVNDFGVYYAVGMPFGGVDGSGYGRFGGEEGLRSLCNIKAVCMDRWDILGIRTAIPPALQLPYVDSENAWAIARGVVLLGYATPFITLAWWMGLGRVIGLVKD